MKNLFKLTLIAVLATTLNACVENKKSVVPTHSDQTEQDTDTASTDTASTDTASTDTASPKNSLIIKQFGKVLQTNDILYARRLYDNSITENGESVTYRKFCSKFEIIYPEKIREIELNDIRNYKFLGLYFGFNLYIVGDHTSFVNPISDTYKELSKIQLIGDSNIEVKAIDNKRVIVKLATKYRDRGNIPSRIALFMPLYDKQTSFVKFNPYYNDSNPEINGAPADEFCTYEKMFN